MIENGGNDEETTDRLKDTQIRNNCNDIKRKYKERDSVISQREAGHLVWKTATSLKVFCSTLCDLLNI